MTRKHVEAIAREIRALRSGSPTPAESIGIGAAARAVGYALTKLNPRFDNARFLRDCGISP